jgi:hypothetical protein
LTQAQACEDERRPTAVVNADGEAVIMLAFQASGRGSTPLRRIFWWRPVENGKSHNERAGYLLLTGQRLDLCIELLDTNTSGCRPFPSSCWQVV